MRFLALWYALFAMASFAGTPETSAAELERVAQRRIFFGHQSVGGNLVEGLGEVSGGKLTLVQGRAPLEKPAFEHALVGRNEAPLTKVADFEKALDELGGRVDVAFFKFCYIDFTPGTDVEQLFGEYTAALTRLRAKYPQVTFVHVTAPLTTVQGGAKAWVKKLLGNAPWGAKENEVRHRYNELLRTRLAGQPLFDLAAVESTRPDGTPERFEQGGQQVPALVAAYSDDGQHLNATGRVRAARALLSFLAKLP